MPVIKRDLYFFSFLLIDLGNKTNRVLLVSYKIYKYRDIINYGS